jgi:hypothetical protein
LGQKLAQFPNFRIFLAHEQFRNTLLRGKSSLKFLQGAVVGLGHAGTPVREPKFPVEVRVTFGIHDFAVWRAQLPDALRFICGEMRLPPEKQ